jgi:ATP-dependent RNA helicase RhlE
VTTPTLSRGAPSLPRPSAPQVSPAAVSSAPAAASSSPSGPRLFASLGLLPSLLKAVTDEGYTVPTPIQLQAIPPLLEGRDLLGCAQTGTGKTAAFLLPVLQRLTQAPRKDGIRALVLAPTRELAAQIGERAEVYGRGTGIRHLVIYGGVGQRPQEDALQRRPDLLVATPGRLLDLMQQGFVRLEGVEYFVLDEADRMLDMGFIHDVKRVIAALPKKRQTLLFSATLPPAVLSLARGLLDQPISVSVTPKATTAELVTQSVHLVDKAEKKALLHQLLRGPGVERSIVFSRTKHGANRIAEQLQRAGITAAAIHGNKSQGARERALEGFRSGSIPVLIATDIAARGIDVDGITHVFNFDLPDVPESYVHRIGRTGRAERTGIAVSFCDAEERPLLTAIERFINRRIPVAANPVLLPVPAEGLTPRAEPPRPPPPSRPRPGPGPRAAQTGAPRQGGPARPGAPRPQGAGTESAAPQRPRGVRGFRRS